MRKLFKEGGSSGRLILLISILLLIPLVVVIFYPEEIEYIYAFAFPGTLSLIVGVFFCIFSILKQNKDSNKNNNGSIVVLFIWLYSFFVGALPFIISGQLNIIQSVFESVSGWTTTGLSVMDVRNVPHIFLFYRSFMQYCGGLGFVMMIVMVIQGKQSMSLYNAEGHTDNLVPNLGRTARTIFLIYISYLVIGVILYLTAGMGMFDAINHSMCALSTGGFSTQYESIKAYNNIMIEVVTVFLMLVGTTNFAVLLLIARRKFREASKVSEVRFMFILLFIFVPLVTFSMISQMYYSFGEAFRTGLFNVVSALSTTGFSNTSYDYWPSFSLGILIVLMIIGGGIGSTSGGIKLTRIYLVMRMVIENIKERFSSKRKIRNPYYFRPQGKTYFDKNIINDTVVFVFVYIGIFILGSLIITFLENCSLSDGLFEFGSAFGTVGLSIGLTGPDTKNPTLFIEMIGMFLGRLEIFIIILGIQSTIKKIRESLRKND